MPRRPRISTGGLAFHVINRGVGRSTVFDDDGDYEAFERVLAQTCDRMTGVRLLSYCLMPSHFHLVPWPREDGELSEFMRLLTVTHTQRWHAHRHTQGTGPVYQGRFKSFPIQADPHLLTVCRYAERNPVRAGLVESAAEWRWGSAAQRAGGSPPDWLLPLDRWPVDLPDDWSAWVDGAETAAELDAIRTSVNRGRPYGSPRWQKRTAGRLGLGSTFRDCGRPRKRVPK